MRLKLFIGTALLALLAACSGETTGAPTSTTPTGTATGSSTGSAAGTCPIGRYEITAISGKAGTEVNGVPIVATSAGGLKLALTQNGTWTLAGEDAPVTLTAAGISVDATVAGTAEGSYTKSGADYLFRQEKATGKVTLKQPVAGVSSFGMDEVGPALAPDGRATLTCGPDTLKITSESVTLDLKGTSAGAGPASPTTTGPTTTNPTTGGGATGGGAGPHTINDSGQTRTIDCAGRDVAMNGSASKLTFTGGCGALMVNGSSNQITLEEATQITVNGAGNQVTYSAGDPKVTNNGKSNTISRG